MHYYLAQKEIYFLYIFVQNLLPNLGLCSEVAHIVFVPCLVVLDHTTSRPFQIRAHKTSQIPKNMLRSEKGTKKTQFIRNDKDEIILGSIQTPENT